jgi:hypothetical protein
VNTLGIRSRLKTERLREFARIEDIVGFVLVEHLVQFSDGSVGPSRHPYHRPGEHPVLRLRSELLGDEFNELFSGRRIGSGRGVPCLIPGSFTLRQQSAR